MLQERDDIMKDKERALNAAQAAMEITIEQEVCHRIGLKHQVCNAIQYCKHVL